MDLAQFWFQAAGGPAPAVIGNSLRFRGGQRLVRTPSVTSNTQTTTASWWMKRSTNNGGIFNTGGSRVNYRINQSSYGQDVSNTGKGGTNYFQNHTDLLRDHSAWYHVVHRIDLTQAVSTDRVRTYINGVLVPQSGWSFPPQNNGTEMNTSGGFIEVGTAETAYFDGYLAEFHWCDGQSLAATDFGEFNADGVWVPKDVSGVTYGPNGWYLDFSDAADIGADRSGNGNNFTPTGFELTDVSSVDYDWMSDSPTQNEATWNPILGNSTISGNANTFAKANRSVTTVVTSTSGSEKSWAAFAIPTAPGGKYYWEVQNAGNNLAIGVQAVDSQGTVASQGGPWNAERSPNWKIGSATGGTQQSMASDGATATGTGNISWSVSQRLGFLLDLDNNTLEFRNNNTTITTLTNCNFSDYEFLSPGVSSYTRTTTTANCTMMLRTGGLRQYTVSGYNDLSTAELPAVAITNPSEHFQTLLSDDAKTPEPAAIGAAYGGGFYAGRIKDGNKVYNLIVAPVTSGALEGQMGGSTPIKREYRVTATPDSAAFQNEVYGAGATVAGADAAHPQFNWAINSATGPNAGNYDSTNAAGTGIGGFNDWYIPAKNELEILYRSLKPTTTANRTDAGTNPNAVPPTGNYTSGDPAQTTSTLFRAGNAQAFATDENYWSATQDPSNASGALSQAFIDGGQLAGLKDVSEYGRAIRREFAYDAGLLDYAQATFPNGLWWIKDRANSNQHQLVDSVRGGNLATLLPSINPEQAYSAPAGNSVAWCWAVDGAAAPNSNGDIPSNVATNQAAGFSIGTFQSKVYTGTAADVGTVGHGLNQAPEFIMVSIRSGSASDQIVVYHKDAGANKYCVLNGGTSGADAFLTSTTIWENTAPTNQVFTMGSQWPTALADNKPMAFYAWHSVPGYSSIGKYVGNGNVDGPFIYTGHRVGWLMIKSTQSTDDWYVLDAERAPYNPAQAQLLPNRTQKEASYTGWGDLLSNGFKIRRTDAAWNASGKTYIYIAFAEHCFGGSNVSPAPAR